MKKFYLLLAVCLLCIPTGLRAQLDSTAVKEIDSLYKEDQFYIGLAYNILVNVPDKVSQSGFSLGLSGGFIKDMPLNKRRNIALGLGIGYAYNSYNQNLGVFKDRSDEYQYIVLNTDYEFDYNRNNFYTHMIEVPFEFRWRTSTPSEYRFWRVYTGFKVGYVIANVTNFKGQLGDVRYRNIDGFNKLQYGLTLSVGYNTWNFYVYYPLNALFEEGSKTAIRQEDIDMRSIKLGLIFYLL